MASAAYLAGDTAGGRGNLAARLLSATCILFGVTEDDLRSNQRGAISTARWALSYVLANRVGWNYARIGRLINKDHSAIVYGYAQAARLMQNDSAFYDAIQHLEQTP